MRGEAASGSASSSHLIDTAHHVDRSIRQHDCHASATHARPAREQYAAGAMPCRYAAAAVITSFPARGKSYGKVESSGEGSVAQVCEALGDDRAGGGRRVVEQPSTEIIVRGHGVAGVLCLPQHRPISTTCSRIVNVHWRRQNNHCPTPTRSCLARRPNRR